MSEEKQSQRLVVLTTASGPEEARVVQAILGAAGITAIVEGDALMDEWAVTQRLLGRVGSEVKVPAVELERAEAALEEARERGLGPWEDGGGDGVGESDE